MKTNTRLSYNLLLAAMATSYGAVAGDTTKNFTVEVPMESKLNDAIQESSAFLQLITMAGVTDGKGQALELGVNGLLAKRTDTSSNDRTPTMFGGPSGSQWETILTEFDVGIPYQVLDQFARYPDFAQRYMQAVYKAIALDRIGIGFHGTSAAAATNPGSNALGQDVNVGWLELLKTGNASNYMTDATAAAGDVISIHADNTSAQGYKSLDGLVADLFGAIPVEYRTGNEVAIIGSTLLAADSNKVYNDHGNTPSEKKDISIMLNSYGGLQSMQVPRFPDTGVLVTDPANLHLYFQEGRTRRQTEEESKRNRVVDYISSNDAYAIGNLKAMAAVDPSKVQLTQPV